MTWFRICIFFFCKKNKTKWVKNHTAHKLDWRSANKTSHTTQRICSNAYKKITHWETNRRKKMMKNNEMVLLNNQPTHWTTRHFTIVWWVTWLFSNCWQRGRFEKVNHKNVDINILTRCVYSFGHFKGVQRSQINVVLTIIKWIQRLNFYFKEL